MISKGQRSEGGEWERTETWTWMMRRMKKRQLRRTRRMMLRLHSQTLSLDSQLLHTPAEKRTYRSATQTRSTLTHSHSTTPTLIPPPQ